MCPTFIPEPSQRLKAHYGGASKALLMLYLVATVLVATLVDKAALLEALGTSRRLLVSWLLSSTSQRTMHTRALGY